MAEEDPSSSTPAAASQEQEQFKNGNLIICSVAADHPKDGLTKAPLTLSSLASVWPGTGCVKKLVIKNFNGNTVTVF